MTDKKTETSSQEASTEQVLALLAGILEKFKDQVQARTPPPLEGDADIAVKAFREISDALDVKAGAFSNRQT